MQNKRVVLALSLLVIPACAPVDPGFGESFRWDMAQQVIDPDPAYEGEAVEGGSGERAAAAVDRYNKGQVKQPVAVGTAIRSSSGSGSSSGPN